MTHLPQNLIGEPILCGTEWVVTQHAEGYYVLQFLDQAGMVLTIPLLDDREQLAGIFLDHIRFLLKHDRYVLKRP